MRLTVVLAVVSLLIGVSGPAHARSKTAADDAHVASLLAHADAISAILEKHIDHPKKALAALDKYLKKRRKPMKQTVAALVTTANELDRDARSDLRSDLLWAPSSLRFMKALQAFQDRW